MGGMGDRVVIYGLAEMVCYGGMIAMVSHVRTGLVVGHKFRWYNSLLWVA